MPRCMPVNACLDISPLPVGLGWVTYDAHFRAQWKFPNRKDLAYFDYNISDEKQLHFPRHRVSTAGYFSSRVIYLRPTAACFRSDLHSKKKLTRIATPQSNMEPGCCYFGTSIAAKQECVPRFPRCLPPLSDMPVNSQEPHPKLECAELSNCK